MARGRRNRVKDIDRGWKKLRKHLPEAVGAYVKIGVPAKVGKQKKKINEKDAKELVESNVTLAMVAWWQEFGTRTKDGGEHVPERSFIRSTHDEQLRKIKLIKTQLVLKMLDGDMRVKEALTILGEHMKSRIQDKIITLSTPPNDPATIKRKGSSNPLVDIAQLLQSITYDIKVPKAPVLPKGRRGRDVV